MAEPRRDQCCDAGSSFKDAVCINAGRVYDSCSDRDCLQDMQVFFPIMGQEVIDNAISVRSMSVEVLNVYIDVETVPFNRGFYSVDMTFFFKVNLLAYEAPLSKGTPVRGVAVFSKKVILYGSEGNAKIYTSNDNRLSNAFAPTTNAPEAKVQVLDPIMLSCRLVEVCCCSEAIGTGVFLPDNIRGAFDGPFAENPQKTVLISLGMFTVVQLERAVQMLIPVYDFCMPDKECVAASTDDPCDMFSKIRFPVDEFFPPKLCDLENDGGACGC